MSGFDFTSLERELNPSKEAARSRKERQRARDEIGEAFAPKGDAHRAARSRAVKAEKRNAKLQDRLDNIAVLDFETDPFDPDGRERIFPFTACLYSENFDPVIIWEENETAFVDAVISAIEALPGAYMIYAHNGGKFDYLFLVSRLRGQVSFKGRGIMAAKIGNHELRDSFHLIPERLGAFQKDEFDYGKMRKANRNAHKDEIIKYMTNDCIYLYDIVKTFLSNYGIKLSIGQAAMSLLRKEYPEVKSIHENDDMFLRSFFYGGRVECIQGRGVWQDDFKLYDVNSMYPYAMSYFNHPIGTDYRPRVGLPSVDTVFVDLDCYSNGAFPLKVIGVGTTFPKARGRYKVSIHEYNTAMELGLISDIEINSVVDCFSQTDFSRFILPLYEARQVTKARLKELEKAGRKDSSEYIETKKDDVFLKLLMNNAYGKFAQNPRNFKEYWLTEPNEFPETERETWGMFPLEVSEDYAVWARPLQTLRYNNVGTAASITGAARSVLMRAKALAIDPIYCDTDSLICRELKGVNIDPVALGGWDIESELSKVMIAGKKLYAYEKTNGQRQIRCKGGAGLKWEDMEQLVGGNVIWLNAKAPTLTRRGDQRYIDRKIRATV